MRIQNKNTKSQIVITNWASGQGKPPKQTINPIESYEVTVNGKVTKVYHNKSKSGIPYYYVNLDGQWMWSRDEFTTGTWDTVTKATPAPKDANLQSTAAQEMGLEKKPTTKIAKGNK